MSKALYFANKFANTPFFLKLSQNDVKVGISTGGDDAQTIHETINPFNECHIIVTATHVKDETVAEVNKHYDNPDIIWIKKAELSDKLNSQGFEAKYHFLRRFLKRPVTVIQAHDLLNIVQKL